MQSSQMWREMLGNMVKDSQEKQRIASGLGVSPITLTRWITGESKPRPQNLRSLLQMFPEYRQPFLELWSAEFGANFVAVVANDPVPYEIPSSFYEEVIHAHRFVPNVQRFNTICDLVLKQAIRQLDPNQTGMNVMLAQCTPPMQGNPVRSLYLDMRRGTYPLSHEVDLPMLFFGQGSLAGHVVSSGRSFVVRNLEQRKKLFPYWPDHAYESMIAYPIHLSDAVAGCLMVVTTLPDYFQLTARQLLVQHYTELITVAFAHKTFYPLKQMELGCMPDLAFQRDYLSSYQQRMIATTVQLPVHGTDVERLLLQQLEYELLQAFE